MDRGRQIDNIQNSNAVFLDRFGKSGKTSTKVSNPPGGKDHFSLGWDDSQQKNQPPKPGNKPRIERKKEQEPRAIPSQYRSKGQQSQQPPQQNQNQQHTSVRVSQRPGGNSNIVFGTDDSNYEHYRK